MHISLAKLCSRLSLFYSVWGRGGNYIIKALLNSARKVWLRKESEPAALFNILSGGGVCVGGSFEILPPTLYFNIFDTLVVVVFFLLCLTLSSKAKNVKRLISNRRVWEQWCLKGCVSTKHWSGSCRKALCCRIISRIHAILMEVLRNPTSFLCLASCSVPGIFQTPLILWLARKVRSGSSICRSQK